MISGSFFLLSVFIGCIACIRIVQGSVVYHALRSSGKSLTTGESLASGMEMLIFALCVTYNCWFLFVRGL